ncbi:MAG: glycerol-3-phosphate dehydrogenase/oxidase [Aridibacter famidurans]|nr:glycerol-3-phosphate dehydrogenase/oxidase [Aridibacter famidurans]
MNREKILESIRTRSEPWDIVVIGGGATGAGCALDAASRGLSVLLLEQADFGKGTSSRSTKLIHGGVRYLEHGNVSLVREALAERKILLDLAPDFIRPQPFIVPCYGLAEKLYYGAGLKIYDALAGRRSLGKTELLSGDETREALPGLDPVGLSGGIRYLDAQFDDARFLLALIGTAEESGAFALNYSRVEEISSGEPARVSFRDEDTGELFEAEAKAVINAAGIFADRVNSLATGEPDSRIAYSQGIHLVFDPEFLPGANALMIPKTRDGRVLFAIPWLGKLLVGTTDTAVDEPALEPLALDSEIEFVLETCAGYFKHAPERNDIRSVFAGIRPLIKEDRATTTSRISREHLVEETVLGMVTVRGGKWTTYRRMAKDAVDAAQKMAGTPSKPCVSDSIAIRDRSREIAAALITDGPGLGEAIAPGAQYTRADVLAAIRNGKAMKLEDVLARRTRLLFLDARTAIEAARPVAELMARELGWSGERLESEIGEFRTVASNYLSDDQDPHS